MPSRSARAVPPLALVLTVLVVLVAGCGGNASNGSIVRPSLTASLSPSRTLPSLSRPTASHETPTGDASAGPTTAPTPSSEPTSPPPSEPTSQPTKTRPPSTPTKTPTKTPTETPIPTTTPTPTAPAGPTSGPPTSAAATPAQSGAADQSSSTTGWWWLLALVVLLVAAVTTLLLVRRARSRRAWESELDAAEHDVAWFARDLVPQLRGSGSFASVSGGWTVAAPRVQALEDRLAGLVTTAPTDDHRAHATAVQDAVRTGRERMTALLVAGETAQWSLALDDVQAPLLAVLVPASSAPGTPA